MNKWILFRGGWLVAGWVAGTAFGFWPGLGLCWAQSNATVIHKHSGMQFSGLTTTDERYFLGPGSRNEIPVISILDGARRVVFPRKDNTWEVDVRPAPVSFQLSQSTVRTGQATIAAVGSTLQALPFNEFGRRRVFIETNKGPVWLLQGITELAPNYARVQGVEMPEEGLFEFPFDFRVATSTIPGATLVQMLRNATEDLGDYQQRERIVEFLIAAERYNEAMQELNQLQVDFQELDQPRFDVLKTRLTTASARLVLRELDRRRQAGQYLTVQNILEGLDPQNVSPETLVDVNTQLRSLKDLDRDLKRLKEAVEQVFSGYLEQDEWAAAQRLQLEQLRDEIVSDLNPHNMDRLATYELRARDTEAAVSASASFVISGWLMGAAEAFDNAPVAFSLIETRELLLQYLNSQDPNERAEIIEKLRQLETGSPRYLAALARHLLPWRQPPAPEPNSRGFYRLQMTDLPGQPEYLVQLPPEYNPYKRYPCIVALCDIGSNPQAMLEWWDGDLSPADGYRQGQASRHGYITIVPDWRKPLEYEYSYDSHAALVVLRALRQCFRMFAIDSDQVFLAGHGIGGEVAWDLGLAHPDTWAGLIPVSAIADRYISFCYQNCFKHLPVYFVLGDNHIPPPRGMVGTVDKREEIFQRMAYKSDYHFLVVIYRGRRSEHFLEEIPHLFTWMQNRRRHFAVTDFSVRTLRHWNNYFWWVELHDLPDNLMVPPQAWNVQRDRKGVEISAEIKTNTSGGSNFVVRNGGNMATFWISPRWANMEQEITISWNRAPNIKQVMLPSRTVILEDLRTRSDTQNPFWASLTFNRGWTTSNDLP